MVPDSLDSQIMAHDGCDEKEDDGWLVVHDSDDEDNAVSTMLAELPRPPWGSLLEPQGILLRRAPAGEPAGAVVDHGLWVDRQAQ